ncbi:MAG: calcium-binding protein [Actinomycetota bacterium]
MLKRTFSVFIVLCLGVSLAVGVASTTSAQVPSVPVPPVPSTGPVPARVAFDSVQESLPTQYYGYHGFTVFDATNNPLYGQYSKFTAVVAGVNGPKTIEGYLDYWGRGVFGYYGQNPGADDLTVTVGPATGTAARVYGANAGSLPQPNTSMPARVTFDAAAQTLPAPWYGYHGFSVADAQGQPVYGQYSNFTAVVAGTSGPITINGKLDYYGRGTIGYYASQAGADTITVTVGAAMGEAARTYGASTQPPSNPIPPLPPIPNAPTGPVPARVVFDESSRSDPAPWFGYHGFSVLDAEGRPLLGQYSRFTATVQGVNGPLTFDGYLDYYGRGVFSYYAARAGADTLTVAVGPAAGEAARTYGVSNPSLPQVNDRPAARVQFDNAAQTLPAPWYGYHGFTVYDAQGTPVYGRYLQFTAVVAGPNGPVTINGQLDYYGRGTIGYWADKPGADTITVNAGSAAGSAARTYAPNVQPPPVGIPPLPPVPPVQAPPVNQSPVARITFDDPAQLLLPLPYYGCHGFTATDATGTAPYGTFRNWTAAVAGPNGPLTFGGQLDYWGRGMFCYSAVNPGADSLTVTVGAGVGEATRTYRPNASIPSLPGVGVPPVNNNPIARATFDAPVVNLPSPWYGCHSFTGTDAVGTPLYGRYTSWTAAVAGPNGPLVFNGQLDYYGRATICYYAALPGADTLTVTLGTAVGEAARTYAPRTDVPPLEIPILPPVEADEQTEITSACAVAAKNATDPGDGDLIKGTSRDDQLWGTAYRGIIYGFGGNDVLKGRGGNDILCSGSGNDGVNGEGGNDQIDGGDGRDLIVGADGDDAIAGGLDIDGVYGSAGNDRLLGGQADGTDDAVADYVEGGLGADTTLPQTDDEVYQELEPDSLCPVVPHETDPEAWIPRLGVFRPSRLVVSNPDTHPCIQARGQVSEYNVAGDGDANYHVPQLIQRGGAVITLTSVEIIDAPPGVDIDDEASVKVEMMPRDYIAGEGRFPKTIDNGDIVTVSGLFVADHGHEDDRENILEIHPAFMVQLEGQAPTFSGKKYAGSPHTMHPGQKPGPNRGKIKAPPNPTSFPRKRTDINNDWRYCWYEDGAPCLDWHGDPTFG